MQIISSIFLLIFLAAFAGIIKPYIGNLTRWQFAVAAFLSLIICGITAPTPEGGQSPASSENVVGEVAQKSSGEMLLDGPTSEEPTAPNVASTGDGSETVARVEEDPFDDVSNQSLWIIKSRDSIKKRLRDPDSAEFRDVRFYSGGSVPVVCGEVNAKNGLGGYSGYERFIASGDNVDIAFLASDVASGDSINNAWTELCVEAPRDEAYVP